MIPSHSYNNTHTVTVNIVGVQVTPLAHMASSNHSIDYGQVDIVGIIITVLSSHITTANGLVISSNLLVN